MRLAQTTSDVPTSLATTSFSLVVFVDEEGASSANHLPLQRSHLDVPVNAAPSENNDANFMELKIFCIIFIGLLLGASYFIVKAAVRTWKRHNADYLLTWALNHQKQSNCKCISQRKTQPPSMTGLNQTVIATAVEGDEGEVDIATGSPTTSSGVGTVDSSDGCVETASTNPLLELMSAPSATTPDQHSPSSKSVVTVAEVALLNTSHSSDAVAPPKPPISRRHHHHRRKLNITVAGCPNQNSLSSPPSPIYPDKPTSGQSGTCTIIINQQNSNGPIVYRHRKKARRRSKRRVSLDIADIKCGQADSAYCYGIRPRTGAEAPNVEHSKPLAALFDTPHSDRLWHQSWRPRTDDDDDDGGSLSIPLSIATAPPDYFDTMSAEWERQGYCPLYKSHWTCGTVTLPGTP